MKTTIWRIARNFIPNFPNLCQRKLMKTVRCPRCCGELEYANHTFRDCPTSKEVCNLLGLRWILNKPELKHLDWLIWVFAECPSHKFKLFGYALWNIWSARNIVVHENKQKPGHVILTNTTAYLAERRFRSKKTYQSQAGNKMVPST